MLQNTQFGDTQNKPLQCSDKPNRVSIDLDQEVLAPMKSKTKKKIQIRTTKTSLCEKTVLSSEYATEPLPKENISDINIQQESHISCQTIEQLIIPKEIYVYKQLLKAFKKACNDTNSLHFITKDKMVEIITSMGYLNSEDSPEDLNLINKAFNTLKKSFGGVKQEDLLIFLVLISGIQLSSQTANKIAEFSPIILDRKKIKQQYSKLALNKIAHAKNFEQTRKNCDKYSFQPNILSNSRKMAITKRNKLIKEANQNLFIPSLNHGVEDILLISRRLSEQKLRTRRKQKQAQQTIGCTFKPKVNAEKGREKNSQTSLNLTKDRCIGLFKISRQPKSKQHSRNRSTVEELQLKELRQCTFKPTFTKLRTSRSHVQVKNGSRSIERLKQGRQIRVLTNTLIERGYPQNVPNWDHFVKCFKKQMSYQNLIQKRSSWKRNQQDQTWIPQNKKPISSINIQLIKQTQRIDIFNGDSIDSLACKIIVRHGLPYQWKDKIEILVTESLKQDINLRLINGFIYERTKNK